jgi:hypothetical protein
MAGREVTVQPGAPRVRYEIDLGKISRHVRLPETEPAVCAFVLGQLEAGRSARKAA